VAAVQARVDSSGLTIEKGAVMRTRVVLAVLSISVVIPLIVAAQQGAGRGGGAAQAGQARGGRGGGNGNVLGRGAPPLVPDNQPFEARDLSGVWLGNKYGFNATSDPAFTAEGKKKFDAQKPSYGATVGTPAAANALRSAWIPAPPPESEPAIVRQRGIKSLPSPA